MSKASISESAIESTPQKNSKMEDTKYLPELLAEKDSLDSSFTHAMKLISAGNLIVFLGFIEANVLANVSMARGLVSFFFERDASGRHRPEQWCNTHVVAMWVNFSWFQMHQVLFNLQALDFV